MLNAFFSFPPLRKINKDRFSKKIFKRIKYLNLTSEIDINKIASDYIDHLNSDLFSPLGRRLHSILSYQSLCEGSRFSKKSDYLDKDMQPPVIIIGLPRSGTTNLHNLIVNNFNYSAIQS